MRIIVGVALLLAALPLAAQENRASFALGPERYALEAEPGFCLAERGDLQLWDTWNRLMGDTEGRFEPKAVFLDCVTLNAIREGAQPHDFALRLVGVALGGGDPLPATDAARVQFEFVRSMFRMMERRPGSVTGMPVQDIVADIAEDRGLIAQCARPRAGSQSVGIDLCFAEPDGDDPMQGGVAVRPVGNRFVAGAALTRPGNGDSPGFDAGEALLDGLAKDR